MIETAVVYDTLYIIWQNKAEDMQSSSKEVSWVSTSTVMVRSSCSLGWTRGIIIVHGRWRHQSMFICCNPYVHAHVDTPQLRPTSRLSTCVRHRLSARQRSRQCYVIVHVTSSHSHAVTLSDSAQYMYDKSQCIGWEFIFHSWQHVGLHLFPPAKFLFFKVWLYSLCRLSPVVRD